MTAAPLKLAVIGAGRMGCNHLRTAAASSDIELVGVYDTRPEAALEAAQAHGCAAFASLGDAVENAEAAVVVTPSTTHGEIGSEFLKTGVHVLMEKPLATTEAEATRLIELARENDVRLMVGHVERFNPAVSALSDVLPGGRGVDWLSTRRMSAASARITDVDVVMDLMIHDVDVVLSLVNSPVADVQATAVRTSRTDGTDCVTAILSFESGVAATLTASRITSGRIRTLRVSAESGFYDMDFIGQTLSVWHQGRHPDFSVQPEYPVEVSQEKVFIRGGQGLANEQAEFVAAIREKRAPKVTGEDGRAALRVAWKIREAAGIA